LSNLAGLKCKECGRAFDPGAVSVCDYCFGPLEADYNYQRASKLATRKKIKKGTPDIWRYMELLPLEGTRPVDLSPGFTPLLKADNLGARLGVKNLYLKDETVNPTHSVKDRMVAVAVSRAVELGFSVVACASTGNLAHSLAAHAARAGLKSVIFVPHDAEPAQLAAINIYEPALIAVKGGTQRINALCNEAMARERWAFVNINLRPYYAEGAKTIAFEIAEQLGWTAPDHIVAPISSGSTLTAIRKGLSELVSVEILKSQETKLHGAQAEGCAPVAAAFRKKSELIQPATPATLAKSLSIGNPADGVYALRAVRDSGGAIAAVSDNEIIEGMKSLAREEGIFAEPAGGAVVAALKQLASARSFKAGETVVAVISGGGLKAPEALSGRLKPPRVIEPKLSELESFLAQLRRAENVPGAADM
jgi:threonine synthase